MSSIETTALPELPKPQSEGVETGLQSPPETNLKDNTSDSDLSDLEPEQETKGTSELHDIQPDHYSPDGSVPVFTPTMEEFEDFQRYLRAVNKFGMRHGIIKVVPPPEWLANQPPLNEIVKTIRIKEPIKQDIMGTNGTYRQANILHQRSYNLPQWRQLCDQSEHQPPAKRGERRANQDKPTKAAPKPKATGAAKQVAKKKPVGRGARKKSKAVTLDNREETSTPDRLPTPDSPVAKSEDVSKTMKEEELGVDECSAKPKGGRQPKAISVSSRRKNDRREGATKVDEEAFKNFDHHLKGVDYSQERCDELERAYWKTLTYAPPLYGADMMGSLFDDRTTTWNLGKLENLLDVLGTTIPGVNTAYLYLGMWKATFAWHLEDVDLYSINYLHFGAPKQWYSISQGDARRFEAAMKTIWPTDAKACDQFLRHKTFLISPSQLLQNFNIKVNKIVHYPGEFVITFPYGYHSGYNLGYNCAEAVNFALDSWLEYGRVAKKCDCSEAQDSVWIDVAAIERRMRGEETEYEETEDEEDEEDEDDDNEATQNLGLLGGTNTANIKTKSKKRKRPTVDKANQSDTKRIRVRIKVPSREPCILCPNDIPSEPLLPTEDGQKAHRLCALYIPETSINSEDEKEIINDIKFIDKARMGLKCNYCRSRKGACFQCSQKKCTRAYHATCAAAAGVLVEQGEIPVFGEDGTEYKDWAIEFSCRFHRTKRDKKHDSEVLGENERILKAASHLKVGESCQLQYFKGDIFAGVVVENRKTEEMLLLDILPRGQRVEVEYKWLLIPDPADYRLPKPSAKAIPMPTSRKDKESLNTTKRLADDQPRPEDVFVEGFTWSEFHTGVNERNKDQAKIDLKKEDQIWYYLGKHSTEAKAQFTEDPAKPRHNPKGHYLETIPKPVSAVPARQSFAASYPSTPTTSNLPSVTAPKPVSRPVPTPVPVSKTDKPYIYKPRTNSEAYRIDPQAYRSQQDFLHQSQQAQQVQQPRQAQHAQRPPHSQHPQQSQHIGHTQQFHSPKLFQQPQPQQHRAPPYSFGTDPRWKQPATKSSTPYNGQPAPAAALPPSSSTPSASNHTNFRPAFTPNYPPTYAPPPKQSNAFGAKTQSSNPNPFAKYSYLQKEHNRSPLEYKTPYRPGGGFMNGYQGNMAEHWKKTLFQNKPASSTPLAPSTLSHGSGARASYPQNQPSPIVYKHSKFDGYGTPPAQSQPQPSPNTPTSSSWVRRDNSQLHPAIRQEYGSLFNNQYVPEQLSSTQQYNGPVMKPPAMFDRQVSQMQAPYQHVQHMPNRQPAQTIYGQASSSSTAVQPQQYPYATPSLHIFHTHQMSPQSSLTSRTTQDVQKDFTPRSAAPSLQQTAPPIQQQPSQPVAELHQKNSPHVYNHQQTVPHAQYPAQTGVQGSVSTKQGRDFPDVPVDSTSLVEKMMAALRKAN